MARTTRTGAVSAAALVAAAVGLAGCGSVPTTPIASTAGDDRICRMLSRPAVRTAAGGEEPKVTKSHVNQQPGDGALIGAVCVVEAGDLYLKVNVNWQSLPGRLDQDRAELASPPPDEGARVFPPSEGVGYVRVAGASEGEIDGSLLRGRYRLDIVLIGVPEPRDRLADAQALLLQAADALGVPVDESAPRPTPSRS